MRSRFVLAFHRSPVPTPDRRRPVKRGSLAAARQRSAVVAAGCVLGLVDVSVARADTLADGVSEQLDIDDEFIVGVSQPTAVAFLPDGRVLVAERTGDLVLRTADGTMTTAGSFDVNSQAGEQGLLNVLPHPDFENNHLLFFYYSAGAGIGGSNDQRHRVVTIELGDDNLLDMSTETVLVTDLKGPANHNGGGITIFDDYLFIGTGDTGNNSNSPPGQNIRNYYPTCFTNAQGKVLRVHLDGSIPSDNPLVGKTVTACGDSPGVVPSTTSTEPREEVFAWGFRNAFRVWADPMTGNVWVGNVGEITYEMIQVVPPSGALHFGWPFREGNEGLGVDECQNFEPNVGDCAPAAYRCEQSDGANGNAPPDNPDVPNDCDSITGGLILNGCQWPTQLEGRYVFGDYQSQRVWTLPINAERNDVIGEREDLMTMNGGPVHFAEYDGSLYVVAHSGNGHVTRISPKNPEASCDGPSTPAPDGGMMSAGGASGTPDGGPAGPSPSNPGAGGSGGVGDDEDPADASPSSGTDDADDAAPGPDGTDEPAASDDSDGSDDAEPSDDSSSSDDEASDDTSDDSSDDDPAGTDDGVDGGVRSDSSDDDGGCGCRVGGMSGGNGGWWMALAAVGLLAARKRRR